VGVRRGDKPPGWGAGGWSGGWLCGRAAAPRRAARGGGRAGVVVSSPGRGLLGRARECARLDGLLAGARAGRSGVLVVCGEAGVGKTALLGYTASRAVGMRVLRAQAVEAESDLAFVVLADLVEPVLGFLEGLPGPRASALRVALGLSDGAGGDRFAVCAATLGVLAAAAEERPLVALVDDAQWLDGGSADALRFAARRLEAEAIALVFAAREGDPAAFDGSGLAQLHVRGLEQGAARALIARATGQRAQRGVADTLARETAGNPLALIELCGLLSRTQLAGSEPLGEPLAVGAFAQDAFARRLAALGEGTRRGLLVAAAAGDGEIAPVLEALEAISLGAEALNEAETAGLVGVSDGRLAFRHPLIRAVIYADGAAPERREAHRALADAFGERRPDRRAWHLAAAALGPDEDVAHALERAAETARQRSGYAAAARALERAAQLTPPGGARADRLAAAADAARQAGHSEHALALFSEALKDTSDTTRRAHIEHQRGRIELWGGRAHRGQELHTRAADLVAASAPDLAAVLLVHAAVAAWYAGDAVAALAKARRAHELAGGRGGPGELLGELALGSAWYWLGDTASAHRLMADCICKIEDRHLAELAPERLLYVSQWLVATGIAVDRASALINGVIEEARAAGAIGLLPYGLYAAFYPRLRDGDWASAYAGAAEGARLAADTGNVLWHAFTLGLMAVFEAAQGRERECRDHARQALALASEHDFAPEREVGEALGLLELGAGRPQEALQHLDAATRAFEVADHCNGGPWRLARPALGDLVEAHVRAGDPVTDELLAAVRRAGEGDFYGSRAVIARCEGLIARQQDYAAHFQRALALHGAAWPFARARTELCYGERLRRARRRADARAHLSAALDTFERLGARPWAERAANELRATGQRITRHDPTAAEQLTPQELQIALLVAHGATNREAATTLFLSPKTIEFHLGHVFRKLAIRSRTELAALLARSETHPPAAAH
jgi:DNA-binding CsgD family transcriptional regulator